MNDAGYPVTGRCQCGSVIYRITEPPFVTVVCHCLDCQKLSATSFSITMAISAASFVLISGKLKMWQRFADSGADVHCYFCPGCGNRIYHVNPSQPEILRFKPGTLDDTRLIKPELHVWTRSRQDWVTIPEEMPQFATQPDNLVELFTTSIT